MSIYSWNDNLNDLIHDYGHRVKRIRDEKIVGLYTAKHLALEEIIQEVHYGPTEYIKGYEDLAVFMLWLEETRADNRRSG